MADTVETVETDKVATEAPIGKAAFTAAKAEIRARAQSEDQDSGEEKPDDTTPAKPAQEPEKPADALPEAGTTEDALLTPEEVSKLSAGDRKLYEKAQKNYTQKTQKLAADRKAIEESRAQLDRWKPLADALEQDPDRAIEYLAQQRGMKLIKADQDTETVQTATDETVAQLPEEWKFLTPLFDQLAKQVEDRTLAKFRAELTPIQQMQELAISNAVAAETKSTIEAFDAKYPNWKQHEPQMLEIGKKFMPAEGAMTDFEYMETLYKLVTASQSEGDRTKAIVEKINRAVSKSEPISQGADSTSVDHVMPKGLSSSERFKAAAKAARRGERWTVTD